MNKNLGTLDSILAVLLVVFVVALLLVVGLGLGVSLWMVLT